MFNKNYETFLSKCVTDELQGVKYALQDIRDELAAIRRIEACKLNLLANGSCQNTFSAMNENN